MKQRALILAAGRGSRMGKSTKNSHKCLSILKNKTLLEWQLKSLNKAGLDNIEVVKGYKQELIEGEFSTSYNANWESTNMIASLFCAKKVNYDTIVSYSDIVYKPSHIEKLKQSKGDIVILADLKWNELWSKRFQNPLDDAESFKSTNNRLTEIGSSTDNINDIEAQFIGLIKLSAKGWEILNKKFLSYDKIRQNKIDFTAILSDLLEDLTEIKIEFINGGWCEVDNVNDLNLYNKLINSNSNWTHRWI
jgi:L-glutamine-phosphate cytidylyltransferase